MSRGLNRVMLIGHLGKDPELKFIPSGSAVCSFSLATNESYKDKEGNQVDRAEWHKLVVWGKQAEIAGKYLKQGQQVFIEGKLQTRSWEKDGQKHYMTEIVVLNFQMLGVKGDGALASDEDKPVFPSDEKDLFDKETKTAKKTAPAKEELPF